MRKFLKRNGDNIVLAAIVTLVLLIAFTVPESQDPERWQRVILDAREAPNVRIYAQVRQERSQEGGHVFVRLTSIKGRITPSTFLRVIHITESDYNKNEPWNFIDGFFVPIASDGKIQENYIREEFDLGVIPAGQRASRLVVAPEEGLVLSDNQISFAGSSGPYWVSPPIPNASY